MAGPLRVPVVARERVVPCSGGGRARLVAQSRGYALVEVAGAVDIATSGRVTEVLRGAAARGTPALIVDLSRVTLFAAAGFHCLEETATLLAGRDGSLHLACAEHSPAARVLRLLDEYGRWTVHPDVPTAVAAVGTSPVTPPADDRA